MRDPDPVQGHKERGSIPFGPLPKDDWGPDPEEVRRGRERRPELEFRLHWSGLWIIAAGILTVVLVSRFFGRTAGEATTVILLVVGAFLSIRQRDRYPWGAGDQGPPY